MFIDDLKTLFNALHNAFENNKNNLTIKNYVKKKFV